MSIFLLIIIFLCLCVDNMVVANMSAMKPQNDAVRSSLSLKIALMFASFNALLLLGGFLLGYIWTAISTPGPKAVAWVSFMFVTLTGIKMLLESIEKSPSFSAADAGLNAKMVKVACLCALNFALIGVVIKITDGAFIGALCLLFVITFGLSSLGFSLGKPKEKSIASKKLEAMAGIILIISAIYDLLTSGIF